MPTIVEIESTLLRKYNAAVNGLAVSQETVSELDLGVPTGKREEWLAEEQKALEEAALSWTDSSRQIECLQGIYQTKAEKGFQRSHLFRKIKS